MYLPNSSILMRVWRKGSGSVVACQCGNGCLLVGSRTWMAVGQREQGRLSAPSIVIRIVTLAGVPTAGRRFNAKRQSGRPLLREALYGW